MAFSTSSPTYPSVSVVASAMVKGTSGACERLWQQRLARTGRPDEQDVRLRQFDIARLRAMLQPL